MNVDTIILPADNENTIVNGLNCRALSGGIRGRHRRGRAENLKKFVENGGKLICFDDSCELVIKRFGLPIKNVLAGMSRSIFYNPGSIVKLQVDTKHPLAKGLLEETPRISQQALRLNCQNRLRGPAGVSPSGVPLAGGSTNGEIKSVARYAEKDALMSGWMLGEKLINGKIALAETTYGKGKIVLFAFRPQHRGQSFATFPFIFNSLEKLGV